MTVLTLHYFRLEKLAEGALELTSEGGRDIAGPGETGTGTPKSEKEKLS